MKAAILTLLLSLPLAVVATEVQAGDSLAAVRTAMGVPHGQLKIGSRQVLYYDRGEVELRDGAVSHVALMSESDYTALEARRAADDARMAAETARLNVEGDAIKARKLADPTFLAAPLTYQLAFWQNFSLRYPGVSVGEQLAVDHLRLAEQFNAQQAQDERLAELEARVSDAEARADAAESSVYHYGAYGYYAGGYNRHPFSIWPVQYHFSKTLAPVVPAFNPGIVTPMNHPIVSSNSRSSWEQHASGGYGRRGRM